MGERTSAEAIARAKLTRRHVSASSTRPSAKVIARAAVSPTSSCVRSPNVE